MSVIVVNMVKGMQEVKKIVKVNGNSEQLASLKFSSH